MHTNFQYPISVKYIEEHVADHGTVLFNAKVRQGVGGNTYDSPLDASYAAYQNVKEALVSTGMVLEEPFRTFYCPLSGKIMKDPVMTSSYSIYEREEIARWFQQSRSTDGILEDPVTKERLVDDSLVPVASIQQTIIEWRERNTLVYIIVAKEALLDDAQRLGVIKKLLSICQDIPMAKDWIQFEGMLPLIIKCLKTRSLDVRKSTFMLLKLLDTDQHNKGEAGVMTECIEKASGSLLREPPLLEAAEFLEELAKSQYGRTQIAQVPSAIVSLVTCATTASDSVVKHIVESTLVLLSDTEDMVMKMAQVNWCSPLLKCLNEGSVEKKLAMIAFVADGALSKESVDYLVQNGIMSILFAIVQSQEFKTVAMRALVNLSSVQIVLHSMVQAGIVTYLMKSFSEEESLSFKLGAASIFETLTLKCRVGYLVRTFGKASLQQLVLNFINVLGDLTLPVTAASLHIHLLKVLFEMAQPPDALCLGHFIRSEQGCLEVLLTLLKPQVVQVCVLSLDLLSLLCDGKEGKEMAYLLSKNVRCLLDLLEDDSASSEVHIATAGVLAKLPHTEAVPISTNALSALVRLSTVSNSGAQVQAVGALLLFMQESAVQHFLVEKDFIFNLVQMLSSSSSLAKSRAAMALKVLSLSSSQLPHTFRKQTFAFYNSWTTCPVHNIQCKVKKNFCIVKAGAVPKLVSMLEDSSMEAAEAALDTLFTLLQTAMTVVNGARLLHELGAVDKLLHLATSKSVVCSEKSLAVLEKVFIVPEIRNKYVSEARRALISLTGCQQSPHLCQKAVRMLSELG